MQIERIEDFDQLRSLAVNWDCLSQGVPFRSWAWLGTWWEHYAGSSQSLYVLAVRDPQGELVGLAPWFLDSAGAAGRVIRFLGSGEVCSDYLSLLTTPEHQQRVSRAVAEWLAAAALGPAEHRWDLLHLDGVDAEDTVMQQLLGHLRDLQCTPHVRDGMNCWRIAFPGDWESYLAMMSKSHRKQVRRAERRLLDSSTARRRTVSQPEDLEQGMKQLVDLHQRRRNSLGEPGCFASSAFHSFLHSAAERLLQQEQLRLDWLEVDGVAVAADFNVVGNRIVYAYQSGVDPDKMELEPGRLNNIAMFKQAIGDGHQAFDFLRGDEPYKAHWRADCRAMHEIRVVPPRASARLRHGVWMAGDAVKHWIKSSFVSSHEV